MEHPHYFTVYCILLSIMIVLVYMWWLTLDYSFKIGKVKRFCNFSKEEWGCQKIPMLAGPILMCVVFMIFWPYMIGVGIVGYAAITFRKYYIKFLEKLNNV